MEFSEVIDAIKRGDVDFIRAHLEVVLAPDMQNQVAEYIKTHDETIERGTLRGI